MQTTAIVVVLIIGLTQAKPNFLGKSAIHSRMARNVLGGADSGGFLSTSSEPIIEECKKNGLSADDEEKLSEAFTNLKICVDKKRMFFVPEDEFTNNINECSKEVIKLSKQCLKEGQRYYPQLLVDSRNAYTAFFYAENDTLSSPDVVKCNEKLKEIELQEKWLKCVEDAADETGATEDIPDNKAEACRILEAVSKCHPKMFAENCEETPTLKRFVDGYYKAIDAPCKA